MNPVKWFRIRHMKHVGMEKFVAVLLVLAGVSARAVLLTVAEVFDVSEADAPLVLDYLVKTWSDVADEKPEAEPGQANGLQIGW